ncbi:hypothetical protein JKF63_02533 [Porcisia hertigi]|uniref:tRNA/rRNA methyltransferase SpoU type domain-containing protein n=1 Tax=Porcisia hertigi TaxID=2761500 RepID=A0A836I154_9TRYP|nr:hypothetical protein JKF63_02533 [Porcisia hertigi]
MRRSACLQKQTLHPPKRIIPLATNPLTRWSLRLPRWTDLGGAMTDVHVGLEGCHSAFNATNSIRTCLYFQTASPPRFLTAASWKAIEHMQVRNAAPSASPAHEAQKRGMFKETQMDGSVQDRGTTGREDPEAEEDSPLDGIAVFGEGTFFRKSCDPPCVDGKGAAAPPTEGPLIAVENFADHAQSIMCTRLPTASARRGGGGGLRLVVGHENWGVRQSLLRCKAEEMQISGHDSTARTALAGTVELAPGPVADMVLYIPQYGTISSLNVVTSLGIALFYCYVDAVCPEVREIYSEDSLSGLGPHDAPADKRSSYCNLRELRCSLEKYQGFFSKALPAPVGSRNEGILTATQSPCVGPDSPVHDVSVNTTPRVDQRPLHPVFYLHNTEEIQHQQRAYRQALLRYSGGGRPIDAPGKPDGEAGVSPTSASPCFGLSVFYENEYDQRNFGGLIRSANAFLVDHIFYVGRRKINVVGAVGSYHYTPPVHLGPLPDISPDALSSDTAYVNTLQDWAQEIHSKVQESYGSDAPRNWWLLDCGHECLYQSTFETERLCSAGEVDTAASSPLSLATFRGLKASGKVRSLCDTEASLREATEGGLMLLVPQEGRLPHPGLMRLCTGILTILPEGAHFGERTRYAAVDGDDHRSGHRGLPSQVASGIALQRLSAVLHPRLAAL